MDGSDAKVSPVQSAHNASVSAEISCPTAEVKPQPVVPPVDDGTLKQVDDVLYSDIGVTTLLNRLKQSIASARDFATFLKKRSAIEDEHARELKRLCGSTKAASSRGESRQDSYARQFNEVTSVHDRMAENGSQFALSLHQMHEDLTELSQSMENQRKQWKHTGLAAESRVQEAERLMEKAKAKYDSLAEDYDGVKTGDKKVGRGFGLRGPKNEEDLQSRVQQADGDYAQKVQHAKNQRQELVSTLRPQAVKAIQDLIHECDSALTLQLQKFATFNEKLLLGNGLLITPLQDPSSGAAAQKSLRDIVQQIDNERDLQLYLRNHHSKIPSRPTELKYEQHPSQVVKPQPQTAPTLQPLQTQPPQQAPMLDRQPMGATSSDPPQVSQDGDSHDRSARSAGPKQQSSRFPMDVPPLRGPHSAGPGGYGSHNGHQQYPPQDRGYQAYHGSNGPAPGQYGNYGGPPHQQAFAPRNGHGHGHGHGSRPGSRPGTANQPKRPTFGVSLDELFQRDQTPVPKIVLDCIQAVELFGIDVEGIYRVPGTSAHVQQLKSMYDNDGDSVDFRNPETFFYDVNSVAGLLKQFFRDLPDPLVTRENYERFIEAAKMQDATVRRDSVHAAINELPDPNYATMRAVVLHLHRVQAHGQVNRMTSTNLAICFAPTLMGAHYGPMQDAGLQAQVVDTILQNSLQIFDED